MNTKNISEDIMYSQYIKSINFLEKEFSVKVLLDPDMKAFNDPNNVITVRQDEQGYIYYEADRSVSLDKIIEFINTTIKLNEEIKEKNKVIVEKFNEFQELVQMLSLEELKCLRFVYDSQNDIKSTMINNVSDSESEELKEITSKKTDLLA